MIGLEDRQALSQDIDTAHQNGARLRPACKIVGIDVRTLQRWKAQQGLIAGDGRPQAQRPVPSHALSPQERAALLAVANETRFASVPPARIVPMLADEGVYLGSESSMARVLKAHGQNARRGRAKAPRAVRPPSTHDLAAVQIQDQVQVKPAPRHHSGQVGHVPAPDLTGRGGDVGAGRAHRSGSCLLYTSDAADE